MSQEFIQQLEQFKPIVQQLKNSNNQQNAQNILFSMMANNPNFKNVIDLVKMGNGNTRQIAQMLADKNNINLNELAQQIAKTLQL